MKFEFTIAYSLYAGILCALCTSRQSDISTTLLIFYYCNLRARLCQSARIFLTIAQHTAVAEINSKIIRQRNQHHMSLKHETSRELIHYYDFTVLNDVIHVF